jgi:uncharacterized phage protein (TIGR02218 family)
VKTTSIALLGSSTRATFYRVQRRDGTDFGFTDCGAAPTLEGIQYVEGMTISAVRQSLDLNANNGEVTWLPGGIVTEADLLTGVWDNAAYVHFECDWTNPDEFDVISVGTTGEVRIKDGRYASETRGLKQVLRNPQGFATQATCRARFADYPAPTQFNILCRLDVDAWRVSGEITAVTSRRSVTDSARTEADDWFGNGIFEATSGDNAGHARRIAGYAAGAFNFDHPFDFDFAPGDAYSAIAGCRGRHAIDMETLAVIVSDCRTKFDNVVNFQGEPHVPGVDQLTQGSGDA